MDVDDSAVDLSVRSLPPELSDLRALTASGLTITPAQAPLHGASGKRVLRPRSEQRSYAESPDIVLLPAAPPHRKPSAMPPMPFADVTHKLNERSVNVSITARSVGWGGNASRTTAAVVAAAAAVEEPREHYSDTEDEEEDVIPAPLANHTELSSAEIWERERKLRALREKLRAEETKLVLLRKIRQSQQTAVPTAKQDPPSVNTGAGGVAGSGCVVPPGVTVTPAPPPAHQHAKRPPSNSTASMVSVTSSRTSSLPGGATLTPGPYRSQASASGGASITPSVTITPAPPPSSQHTAKPAQDTSSVTSSTSDAASSRSSEDNQTPAQRQAAAKLALRKQLEKTLLQIPPPKPPPPEMNFIPSPSNTDFVYLVGLEHVVDYLTHEDRFPRSGVPAVCSQCLCDFTPVWRWERSGSGTERSGSGTERSGSGTERSRKHDATFSAHQTSQRRLCELCVSGNVKRALKAEHTARLKTAFVRALQQEQEIERRLGAASPPAPAPSPAPRTNPPPTNRTNAQMSVSRSSSRSSASASSSHPTLPPPQQPTKQAAPTSNSGRVSSESRSHSNSGPSGDRNSDREAPPPAKKPKGSTSSSSNQGSGSNKQHQQLAAAAAAQMAFEQQSVAAMHALQQQLLRGLSGSGGSGGMSPAAAAAAMMQFSPLLYTYQLAMAQASAMGKRSGKSSSSSSQSNQNTASMAADMQRVAEAQRQYLLDMIPGQHSRNPWSKNQ